MKSNNIIPAELTSVCVQLAIEASKIISSIQKSASTEFKLKGEKDPLTQADLTAQAFIMKGLRLFWPEINIVGEEDQLPQEEWKYDLNTLNKTLIPNSYFCDPQGSQIPEIQIKNSITWLDPLDGTLNYIKGDMEAVTTLIGVSENKHPILGIIGHLNSKRVYFSFSATKKIYYLPFDLSTPPQELIVNKEDKTRPFTLAVTKNRMTPDLEEQLKQLGSPNLLQCGGCGRKILSVIFNESDAYYTNTKKTKKWDICAGEAFINAIGGKLVNCKGNQYEYIETEIDNSEGVLAVTNDLVAKKILDQLKQQTL